VSPTTAVLAGLPLLLVLGLGAVVLVRWLSADPADAVRLPPPRTSWQYEVHLVVPLPPGSPARDDVISEVALLEDRLRPELAAAGARLDADDEGEREFSVVTVGDDVDRLISLLTARARGVVPAGSRLVTYRWRADGAVGTPLRTVPIPGPTPLTASSP
jgi:hypothetical protein